MILRFSFTFTIFIFLFCAPGNNVFAQQPIAYGEMPNLVASNKQLHLVYGREDTLLYRESGDLGKKFSDEKVIAVIPGLASSHTRGPQVARTSKGLLITVCNERGDITSFLLDDNEKIIARSKVNDVDTTAKENLMALSADGDNVFATWLDLRSGRNQIYGAASSDGGRSWKKNIKVYSSPDTTVCECCKPSAIVHGSKVYVMFRNWLNGYRDLYVARSDDKGLSFQSPEKVGTGSWKLAGCPMDGGAFTVTPTNEVYAVFNRDGEIYSCKLGESETKIGTGRGCTMDQMDGQPTYAWVEKGNVVVSSSNGSHTVIAKGKQPVVKVLGNGQSLVVWENDKQIFTTVIELPAASASLWK